MTNGTATNSRRLISALDLTQGERWNAHFSESLGSSLAAIGVSLSEPAAADLMLSNRYRAALAPFNTFQLCIQILKSNWQ